MSDETSTPAAAMAMADPHAPAHARYLGGTQIWMPDLGLRLEAGLPRCCDQHPENEKTSEHEAWLEGDEKEGIPPRSGFDPRLVLNEGDVIVMDLHSAAARSDFQLLDDDLQPIEVPEPDEPVRLDALLKTQLVAMAAKRGVEIAASATKPQIIAALEAHEAEGEPQSKED